MTLHITEIYRPELSTSWDLRLFLCRVPAGFPSLADDYFDEFLDLNKKLITNKSATLVIFAQTLKKVKIATGRGEWTASS